MYCMQFIIFLLQDYDPKGTGVLRADDIPTALGTAVFSVKFHSNSISSLVGVALTRYMPPPFS
jgi:hypothetical protein